MRLKWACLRGVDVACFSVRNTHAIPAKYHQNNFQLSRAQDSVPVDAQLLTVAQARCSQLGRQQMNSCRFCLGFRSTVRWRKRYVQAGHSGQRAGLELLSPTLTPLTKTSCWKICKWAAQCSRPLHTYLILIERIFMCAQLIPVL